MYILLFVCVKLKCGKADLPRKKKPHIALKLQFTAKVTTSRQPSGLVDRQLRAWTSCYSASPHLVGSEHKRQRR